MKKIVGVAMLVTLALVVLAAPGYAVAGVTGTASNNTTILKVQVGSTVATVASDLAEVLNTSTLKATSQFVTGTVGSTALPGGASRSSSKSSENGTTSIGTGTKSLAGLASLNITSGGVNTSVAKNSIQSAVSFVVGSVNALGGFTNLATVTSDTLANVGLSSSSVTRTVKISHLDLLDLRSLLDNLGVDPLNLACGAVSSVGAQLGVATSTACSVLTSVTSEITQGNSQLGVVETAIGLVETVLAPLCALAPAGTCTTITSQINSLQSSIDAAQSPNPVPSICTTVLSTLDDVSAQLTVIKTTLDGLTGGALGSLTALIDSVVAQVGGTATASSQLDSVCTTLAGLVDTVLDLPLVKLDGINVVMGLNANKTPSASASGSIGALKVGNITIANATDLISLGSQLQSVIGTLNSTLGTVFSAVGLAGLPIPTIDLLKVTTAKGKNSSGSYFAQATFNVAKVTIPAANITLPQVPGLDALTGFGGFAPASVKIAAVASPAVSVQAGSFSGSSAWKAGAVQGGGTNGGTLPVTGVADAGLVITGIMSLAGAGVIRRFTKRV